MEKKILDSVLGFSWEPIELYLPRETRPGEALFIFKKNLVGIVWNSLGVFENNPSTLPQTETILQGQSVGGISIDQLTQVKRFGEGTAFLAEAVKAGTFSLDIEFASKIHALVGKEEALEWGVLRNQQVHIHGVSYVPPATDKLPELATKGFSFLQTELKNPIERAIATFLFMARSQFFFDCNKRTAALMLNGALIAEGLYPITVLRETTEEFNSKLKTFYDTGRGTEMFNYFKNVCDSLYPTDIQKKRATFKQ